MKTKYYFLAALAGMMLASCSDDAFVGDNSPNVVQNESAENAINFGFNFQNATRGDIAGGDAAEILGNFFYVEGTKADMTQDPAIPTTSPTTSVVFDNYFVQYTANTAGTTVSNTANWEYVGKNPGTAPLASYPKLSGITGAQTIKYWDYSSTQYDFFAFSTGKATPVTTTPAAGAVGSPGSVKVSKMNSGATVSSNAYTFEIPSEIELKEVYITDITPVEKAKYGSDVTLKFKNLGSKIRLALYETVPGYAVSDVKFYTSDVADTPTKPGDLSSSTTTTATLISTGTIPTSGTIVVSYPHTGTNNKTTQEDYNMASVVVTPLTGSGSTVTSHGFGTLEGNYVAGENVLTATDYLGRTLPTATFAGEKADDYYTTVFPVSSSNALTLRVDYTLTATDGSGEKIKVYGAKASVPATYTVWRPNYAYTYIFKISDATNGWTSTTAADPAGLFPITFDAVVAEVTDVTAEQTTVTTVSTPSITTYQQGHDKSTDEYPKTSKNIYVQVMNTSVSPAVLYGNLTNDENSFVYELSESATEAKVLDALQMRTTAVAPIATANVVGRNGLTLKLVTDAINNAATTIVNGVDDQPITIDAGKLGEIDINKLTAGKEYAYVYIQTAKSKEVDQFEAIPVTEGSEINSSESSHTYYKLTVSEIAAGDVLAADAAPVDNYLYFSVVEDGTGAKTYYYISTIGKKLVPKGSIKVAKNIDASHQVLGSATAEGSTFYFDKYITNDAKYAVKVIKVVTPPVTP